MLEIKSVSKSFSDVNAVNNVDLILKKGTFLGLLGPNGAGKTTLIRMIIGLLDCDDGEILLEGQEFSRDSYDLKKKIGVVFQNINLDKEISVLENMYFTGKLYKMESKKIEERTDKLLNILGLEKVKHRVCKKLSGGMKRKLMIAKAIIHEPDYVFLDEPTVGIDLNSRKQIWDLLKAMHYEGKTLLLTTHYIEEAQFLCDSVALMDEGKIFHNDTTENLINDLGKYTLEYFDKSNETKYRHFNSLKDANEYARALENRYTVRDTTLEDVFFSFTNKKVN